MQKIKITLAAILISIASFLLGGYSKPIDSPVVKGSIDYPSFDKMGTSSAITVGTGDTLIQATTSRQYMVIVNDGSNVVYLALDGDTAAVANKGIRLNAAGGSYEIMANEANDYRGAIRAIAVGGSSVVTVSGK